MTCCHLKVFRPALPCLLAVLAATLLAPAAARAEEPLDLLFYGNSFTNGSGGVPFIVRDIAVAAGRPAPNVENAAVDGQTLGFHRTSNTAVIANPQDFAEPAGFQWDAVVLQEFSTKPTHIGNPSEFRSDAVALFNAVKGHSAAVKPVLFETWARSPGHEFYPDTFASAGAMQAQVRTNYGLARDELDAAIGSNATRIGPVGDAFENAGWSDLYAGDLYHANNRGSLLAGLVLYSTIYQDDTADIDLSGVLSRLGLTAQDGARLTAVADQTVAVPEPTAAGFAVAGAALLLRRRRRST